MLRLEGKVAVVTGAGGSGSIGRAIALGLSEEGAAVVINDFGRRENAEQVAHEIHARGSRAHVIMADVSRVTECQRLIDETVDQFGGVDILVNNAGTPKRQPVADITEADWNSMLDVFLKGPFFLAQRAAPHMCARGGGRIVNISSEQAYTGHPTLAHYTAAKAGLRTLTKSLALAFAPEVTVNTVCPGPTATERFRQGPEFTDEVLQAIPLKRWGQPEDVARSVLFLVTSDGDAFTGQTLDPNCGTVMP
jgi:3-oxoacyl-[acyl-carrier protein] reductase